MKRTLSMIALLLSGMMLLSACGSDEPAETSAETTAADDGAGTPASTELQLIYQPQTGSRQNVTGEGSVELTIDAAYTAGDVIRVNLPQGQHYLAVSLAKGVVEEAILYLPNSVFSYTAQNTSLSYPPEMRGQQCTFTARIPTEEELAASRNLALNPADLMDAKNIYPHASSSSVHDVNNESNRLQFESRNVIDGFTQNNGHGGYPLQSWGPASDMDRADDLTINFGREVSLTELIVYIRADFPHDTYWKSCTVTFSDGSTMKLELGDDNDAQSFKLDAPVTTSSIKFTGFTKAGTQEWASWMEVQAIGSDIVG